MVVLLVLASNVFHLIWFPVCKKLLLSILLNEQHSNDFLDKLVEHHGLEARSYRPASLYNEIQNSISHKVT